MTPKDRQTLWLALVLALFAAFFSLASPYFWSLENLRNVLDQSSINLIAAVGMTFVIASAGIDLSAGSVVAASGVVMAALLRGGFGVPSVVAAGFAAGALCGLANALLVVRLGVTPFMATLTTMNLIGGATLIATQGIPIYGFSRAFSRIGRDVAAGLPLSIWIAGAVWLLFACVVRFTKFGLYAEALGDNEEALKRCGVATGLYKGALYVLCGAIASLASVILTAKLNSAEPLAGAMVEMNAIATVILGGTSIRGGSANMTGTLLAALIMGVLKNGLVLMGISSYYQQFVTGAIILVAVVLSERSRCAKKTIRNDKKK